MPTYAAKPLLLVMGWQHYIQPQLEGDGWQEMEAGANHASKCVAYVNYQSKVELAIKYRELDAREGHPSKSVICAYGGRTGDTCGEAADNEIIKWSSKLSAFTETIALDETCGRP